MGIQQYLIQYSNAQQPPSRPAQHIIRHQANRKYQSSDTTEVVFHMAGILARSSSAVPDEPRLAVCHSALAMSTKCRQAATHEALLG